MGGVREGRVAGVGRSAQCQAPNPSVLLLQSGSTVIGRPRSQHLWSSLFPVPLATPVLPYFIPSAITDLTVSSSYSSSYVWVPLGSRGFWKELFLEAFQSAVDTVLVTFQGLLVQPTPLHLGSRAFCPTPPPPHHCSGLARGIRGGGHKAIL